MHRRCASSTMVASARFKTMKDLLTRTGPMLHRGYHRPLTGATRFFFAIRRDDSWAVHTPPRVFKMSSVLLSSGVQTETSSQPAVVVNDAGAKAYQEYLETLQQIEYQRAENERRKSEQMYTSWKKATDKDALAIDSSTTDAGRMTKNRSAGVAIVRTLASQHQRPTHDAHQQQSDSESQLKERAKTALFTSADTLQYPPAQVQLANDLLLEAVSSNSNSNNSAAISQVNAALSYYRRAGEQGLSEGWFNLGHFLWTGMDGVVDASVDEALCHFRRAIELGDCDAMFFLGAYTLGPYVDNDASAIDETTTTSPALTKSTSVVTTNHQLVELQQALQWIEEAAASGHGGALHYLTTFYLNGFSLLGISPCGDVDFLGRLDAAIEHDKTGDAHFLRGSCYYTGSSWHTRDANKALNDFLTAADLGHADAAVNAGIIFHQGSSEFHIPFDHQRAFQLYQLAGELGSVEGWRNVVACYATGEGVKQSMETAKYIAETMLRPSSD